MKNVILFLFLVVTLKTAAQKGDTLFNDSKCPAEVQYHGVKFNSPVFDGYPLPLGPPPVDPPPVAFGPTGQEKRIIHWVHGLAGNTDSWAEVAGVTEIGGAVVTPPSGDPYDYPARKVQSELHTYNDVGIEAGITTLRSSINQIDADPGHTYDRDFIIAHSQGGIVSRGLDAYLTTDPLAGQRKFQGIATFSTPHAGAQILNSRNEGLMDELISDLCTNVLSAKVAGVLEKQKFLDLFIDLSATNVKIEDFCNTSGVDFAGLLLSSLRSENTLSADYLVGADYLENLNAVGNPDVYKAAFASIEYADSDDNTAQPKQLLWRMLSSFDDTSELDAFTADTDNERVDTMNNLLAEWEAKYFQLSNAILSSGVHNCSFGEWLIPILIPGCIEYEIVVKPWEQQANTYHSAIEWLNGVDDQWATIIGARENVYIPGNNECVCTQWTYSGQPLSTTSYFLDNPEDCNSYGSGTYDESAPFYTSCMVPSVYEVQWKESDGAVLRESQEAFPGVMSTMRLEKMNHFQVRNSSETARGLNKLFDGTILADEETQKFFKTDKKQ